MRLSLVALLVRDYDEAIDWFMRALGFRLASDDDQGGGKRWVVVRPPGSEAGLLLAKAAGDQARVVGDQGGGRVFLFLQTDDFGRDQGRDALEKYTQTKSVWVNL